MIQGGYYIGIEGPIGVGKTSLTQKLARYFRSEPVLEMVEDNPFIEGFYQDRGKHAFAAQIFFLLTRYRQLEGLVQQDLFRRVILCDYIFEKDRVFAAMNLTENELNLYTELYRMLEKKVPAPDLVIYLQAGTKKLLSRIRQRGRPYEKEIDEEYVGRVNETLDRFIFHYSRSPVLIVNADEVNFEEDEGAFIQLIEKIRSGIRGTQFFNPLGSGR
jgi:deoxyadenosine/deoxycytidine kinase